MTKAEQLKELFENCTQTVLEMQNDLPANIERIRKYMADAGGGARTYIIGYLLWFCYNKKHPQRECLEIIILRSF